MSFKTIEDNHLTLSNGMRYTLSTYLLPSSETCLSGYTVSLHATTVAQHPSIYMAVSLRTTYLSPFSLCRYCTATVSIHAASGRSNAIKTFTDIPVISV